MLYPDIFDKYYETGSRLREILFRHSSQVAEYALGISARRHLRLSDELVTDAAMLHDIGICRTYAPSIKCQGTEHYIRHGVIGGQMLRSEGVGEAIARVAERHTGAGLTQLEIIVQHLPLPPIDYLPETLLEQLICYADKFFSKSRDMQQKPLDKVLKGMQTHGDYAYQRFLALHEMFG